MPGQAFLFATAGLGVTIAGFAGLITALDTRPNRHRAVQAYRVRNIVLDGFGLTLASLGAIAVYAFADDNVAAAVRFATLILILGWVRVLTPANLSGPAWDGFDRRTLLGVVIPTVILIVIAAVSLVAASFGFLQVLIVLSLLGPFTVFYRTVRDTYSEDLEGGLSTGSAPDEHLDAGSTRSQGRPR